MVCLMLSVQRSAAVTQNDINCAKAGGTGGTCLYEACSPASPTPTITKTDPDSPPPAPDSIKQVGSVPSGFKISADILAKMNTNKEAYFKAAEKYKIPWQMLAAVHYAESGSDPGLDMQAGNPVGTSGPQVDDSYTIYGVPRTLEASAEHAAHEMIDKVDSGTTGKKLNIKNPSDAAVKDAFYGKNGRAYGSANNSPYVMNYFDEAHANMNGNVNAGTFTIYKLLGGGSDAAAAADSSSSSATDPNQAPAASCCSSTGGDNIPANAAGDSGSPQDKLNLTAVASKYDLQSAIILTLDGKLIGSYNANKPPATPASTMKLIIVDTVLRDGISLNKSIAVNSEIYYGSSNDLGVSSITIGDAIEKTLNGSSNVGANVLIKALGGVGDFTHKAHSYGYVNTDVKGYYSPENDGVNDSTISEQAEAMSHIFSTEGQGYKIAQTALQSAAQSDNHYGVNSIANKWAGTSTVAGNVGRFKVGSSDYIIGLYYNGNMTSSAAISAVKNGSADLVKLVQDMPDGGGSSDTGTTACCSINGDGSPIGSSGGPNDGAGGDSGSWNSGLQPPYILEQWAIETLKDLAHKKGASESDAVTKQHVLALVAFAMGEGGDIMNSDLYNPLNTGIAAPELVDGAHRTDGVQAFKSFDAGVEGAARTLAKSQYTNLAKVLLNPNSTAKQFMYALSYNWKNGGAIWAEASKNEPAYYQERLDLIQQVQSNYKGTAGLVIGTPDHEQAINKTEASKLQFDSGGSSISDASDNGSACDNAVTAGAEGIAQEAIKLSWPESHGTTPTDAYRRAYTQYNPNGPGMADCGGFVATVMHAVADKNYPPGGTANQEAYVRAHPQLYDVVDKVNDVSELQPGDILIVNSGSGEGANGHTLIYVGKQPPNGYDAASASLGSRAANLGNTVLHDDRGDYLRARFKG